MALLEINPLDCGRCSGDAVVLFPGFPFCGTSTRRRWDRSAADLTQINAERPLSGMLARI
jgi:hypothetical protein